LFGAKLKPRSSNPVFGFAAGACLIPKIPPLYPIKLFRPVDLIDVSFLRHGAGELLHLSGFAVRKMCGANKGVCTSSHRGVKK
jgi:hypothetical protein